MVNIPAAKPKDGVTLEDYGIVPPAEVRELIAFVLLSEEEIQRRVGELAEEIARIYADEEELILLPILTGAVFLATDIGRALARSSSLNIKYDLTKASSYESKKQQAIRIQLEPVGVRGKSVLLLDDVLDRGTTMATLRGKLREWGAKDIRACVMFNKLPKDPDQEVLAQRRAASPEFVGFEIPLVDGESPWIGGYGLDSTSTYHLRHLPCLVAIK
ncbi:MAG: phosphoribosyltransferase family protein [Gammaproteobacteria bacterium]|nr:phosphoribosyltransferase family protein [Gammaproteobacteria bacterium]